jgi:hypothetical protein
MQIAQRSLYLESRDGAPHLWRWALPVAAATALVAAVWCVADALGQRGVGVCQSDSAVSSELTMQRPCIARYLAGDLSERDRIGLHLGGNCQSDRSASMISQTNRESVAAAQSTPRTCLIRSRA